MAPDPTPLYEGCKGLVLAVSGGPDSMAMLDKYAKAPPPFPLAVAHVNHGLRPESDGEEMLVRDYCSTRGIPCFVRKADVKNEMQRGETVESAARRIRYEFFRRVAAETGATHLATAHTRDDQCETVLLHLLHGAGAKGLCGILPLRREGNLTVVRPLLSCGKDELIAYCQKNAVPYAVDASNGDLSYTRNRIRHLLLPEMEKINPNVRKALCRTAESLQMTQAAAEARATAFLALYPHGIPADLVRALPEGEQAEILRKKFEEMGKSLSFEQTGQALALLKKETGSVEFDRKYRLHLGQNRLTFSQKRDPLPTVLIESEITDLPDGRILRLEKRSAAGATGLIPLSLPLTLRPRKPGDRMGTGKTLSDRMAEAKIPQPDRDRLWILAAEDRILWCEGIGTDPDTLPKNTEEGYFVSLSEQ